MSLGARIQKLEVVAAPIRAEQQRRREIQEMREVLLREMRADIQNCLAGYRYVLADDLNEGEITKDVIELGLLYEAEATERFGVDERGFYKAAPEQLNELHQELMRQLDAHFYGNHQTIEEQRIEKAQWEQVRADMAVGVPSAESEAAEYLRQLFKRYPRKQNAERFYDIWD